MIIFIDEYLDGVFVHAFTFRKGECLPDESSDSLAQGVIATLDMVGAPAFVAAVVLLWWNDLSIGFPQIGVAEAFFVTRRNRVPQHTARPFASTSQSVSYDLSGATTQSQPQPNFVLAS